MRYLTLFLLIVVPGLSTAETIVATRTIRAMEIVDRESVRVDPAKVDGAYATLFEVVGYEAKTTLYPGRPILRGTLGEPALVDRNQIVEIIFARNGLRISAEGRALGRGGAGDRIRVMNMSSRATLFGTIDTDGTVRISNE